MNKAFFDNKLFEGVGVETLEELEVVPAMLFLQPGEILFDESDPGDSFFLVTEGAVRISKSGRGGEHETLVTIEAGEYFGEMAMLDGRPRSARCCAVGPTWVGRMDRRSFEKLMAAAPQIAVNFSRHTVERLRHTNQHFMEQLLQGERLSLLGRMVGAMVHDFRNPMATILMGTTYLKKHREDAVSQKLASAIEEAVDRMMQMTNELLDFSRGVSKVDPQRVSVVELLKPVEEDGLARLPESGIKVILDIAYKGDLVVDRHRIVRLLLNVVTNAVEAMPEGGTLTISVAQQKRDLMFTISDTGCGMSKELAQRVFEPFFTHGKSNGTGLGMAIARSTVESHGGSIWIESQVGQGTSIFIVLPRGTPENV
jgi:signal transduction histidine kinase